MSVLLRQSAVRYLILDECRRQRPDWNVTRVSAEALDVIERKVITIVRKAVHAHPSVGKTFKEVY